MSNEPSLWALMDLAGNVVLRVDSATEQWITEWRNENQGSGFDYRPTAIENRDYAGIGWSWNDTLGRFIRPMPDEPGEWVYSEEDWDWINLDPP